MTAHFHGARVLSLESRRQDEMRTLIESLGGVATVAPSLREVPLENDSTIAHFAQTLEAGAVHELVLMTGIGTRLLFKALEPHPKAFEHLAHVNLVLRSGKAIAVLRDRGLRGTLVSEPHTWREVQRHYEQIGPQPGRSVTIAEFGNDAPAEFVSALEALGLRVTTLPVYRWALPEDTAPLEAAIHGAISGDFDWLLLTSGVQLWHATHHAKTLGVDAEFHRALTAMRLASIGPTCSDAMHELALTPTIEASPHKMGNLVRVAAQHEAGLRTTNA